jgi:hypothetical protein
MPTSLVASLPLTPFATSPLTPFATSPVAPDASPRRPFSRPRHAESPLRAWARLASTMPRTEFVREYDGWFLVGRSVLAVSPVRSARGPNRLITLGRTHENDVVVPNRTVSRLHAWFRDVAGRLEVGDGESRNGTWVGGHRLAPRESVRLRGGEEMRLGVVELTFVDASGCWEYLRGLA